MKIVMSAWWGVKGIIHWEILPADCTVTGELYCQQLERVAAKLHRKQDRIYFLYDSAKPHIAKSTREKLLMLGWISLRHLPYPSGSAPTDYHLFRSLSNYLIEKKFDNENDLRMDLANFFAQKSQDFCERGIFSLSGRWQQVIDSNGAYMSES